MKFNRNKNQIISRAEQHSRDDENVVNDKSRAEAVKHELQLS